MKKLFFILMCSVGALSMNAQSVFVENFATAFATLPLEGTNNWYVSPKSTDALGVSPIIADGALTYPGYFGSNVGKVAVLAPTVGFDATTQRISTRAVVFAGIDSLKPIVGQKMYAAFMVNIAANSIASQRDFFTWEGSTTSSFTRGRIFAKVNATSGDLTFAVSKNSSSSTTLPYVEAAPIVAGAGVTNLLVLCYEGVSGDSNDIISLYINPDLSKTEALQTNKLVATDTQTDYSVTTPIKINIRQRGVAGSIGGIRVGTSWNSVLLGQASGIEKVNMNNMNIKAIANTIVTEEAGIVKVFNFSGKEVISTSTTGRLETSLNKGFYLVRFVNVAGQISSAKVEIK